MPPSFSMSETMSLLTPFPELLSPSWFLFVSLSRRQHQLIINISVAVPVLSNILTLIPIPSLPTSGYGRLGANYDYDDYYDKEFKGVGVPYIFSNITIILFNVAVL